MQEWGAWIAERWAADAVPSLWVVGLAAAFIVLTVVIRPLWKLTRNAVTIVHEMGHVVVARLMGRKVSGIRLHSDTSGLAITSGKPRGLGVLLSALAGYPAPGIVGVVLVWTAFQGYAGAALVVLTVVLAVAVLLVRNLWGLLVTAVSFAGAGWALWAGDPVVIVTVVLVTGLFLAVGGFRAVFDLRRAHWSGNPGESDAVAAARESIIPATVWVWVFFVITFFCMAQVTVTTAASVAPQIGAHFAGI